MPEHRTDAVPCPADRARVTDLYFMEHRAKLIDIAAFLDRVDRSEGEDDFRVRAFREAVAILTEDRSGRAGRGAGALPPTTPSIRSTRRRARARAGRWTPGAGS